MTTIGCIGLGAMGRRMAARLLDAGHDLVVWNRTPGRATALIDRGARPAAGPGGAAAGAEVVLTMVADPAALAAVVSGADGIAAGITGGATVIEMSTVGPAAIADLAAALPPGVGVLDAPVLGSTSEAEAAKDAALVTGAAAAASADLRLAEAALTWLREADEAGWGRRDYSSVVAWIRDRNRPPDAPPDRG